ncbi:uncharacterized protein LOC118738404 [Rhagoletis pomonella]|uniref:uncharacterized protein LOC118738404 n=1 Tax=Rhagoletis pomonella TaxID=28610 RepID=UPI001786AF10|nr:uncharacterized protein LOC118738404 [Rhagoletis pomonella]
MLGYSFWLLATLAILSCTFGNVTTRTATGSTAQQLTAAQAKDGGGGGSGESAHAGGHSGLASSGAFWGELSQAYRIYKQCAQDNLSVCLKVKLLTGLQRVMRASKVLKLMDGVQFVKSDDEVTSGSAPKTLSFTSEKELEAVLPRGEAAKEQVLHSMIAREFSNLLQNFTLQVKFPYMRGTAEHTDADITEGRKKKDKKGGGGAYIMIPLLLGGTFIPIAYGALAMLAGKALIVSKLALVLASIIGIKKLLSGHSKESHEVVVSSGGHSDWGRDMDLAYNGWKPGKENVKTM